MNAGNCLSDFVLVDHQAGKKEEDR